MKPGNVDYSNFIEGVSRYQEAMQVFRTGYRFMLKYTTLRARNWGLAEKNFIPILNFW